MRWRTSSNLSPPIQDEFELGCENIPTNVLKSRCNDADMAECGKNWLNGVNRVKLDKSIFSEEEF